MADLADLVGVLMQSGLASSGSTRIGNAVGEKGLGGAGGILGDLLGGSGGGLLGSVLGGLMGGGSGRSSGGGLGGLGDLAGAIFGGRGGSSDSRASGGGLGGSALAIIAGLALQALSNRGGASNAISQNALPLGLRAPETQDEQAEMENGAALLLRAMINAAKADGQIDEAETQRIVGKLKAAGADDAALGFVTEEMRKPLDLDGLAASVGDEQTAAQVYAASLFAIEVDTDAERDYLRRLSAALNLDEAVVGRIHQALGVA